MARIPASVGLRAATAGNMAARGLFEVERRRSDVDGQSVREIAVDAEHAALMATLGVAVEGLAAGGDRAAFAHGLAQFVADAEAHVAREVHRPDVVGNDAPIDRRLEHARFVETAHALLHSVTTRYDAFDNWGVALYFLRWLNNHIDRANANA